MGAEVAVCAAMLLCACATPTTEAGAEVETESSTTAALDSARPNWHEDVAPMIHARCVGCHAEGGVAPFALGTYAQSSAWAVEVAEAVAAGTMPPWGAQDTPECTPAHAWLGDLRLSDAEVATLVEWEALGAPEGDPDDAAPLPAPADTHLDNPDGVLTIPEPVVIGGTEDIYACISLDPGFDSEVWVTGAEVLVDNEAIVHHALLMIDPTGATAELADESGAYPCDALHEQVGWFGSYFPGSGPTVMPEGVGAPVPAGGRMVINFHYHPTGTGADVDQSGLALRWTTEAPEYDAVIAAVGNAANAAQGLHFGPGDPNNIPTFLIPAGAEAHTETMSAEFPEWLPESELFMLTPHMHYLGTDLRATLEREGQTSCLIQDPRWDFDWQLVYGIDGDRAARPTVRAGDRIELRCTYDNSLGNPALVELLAELGLDEPIDSTLGDSGVHEMCMLIYGVALPHGFPLP